MNNIMDVLTKFKGFLNNPAQIMTQSRLPQNALQNPQAAIQQLMNSGQMSQQQFNQLQQMAKRITGDPMFAKMFGK